MRYVALVVRKMYGKDSRIVGLMRVHAISFLRGIGIDGSWKFLLNYSRFKSLFTLYKYILKVRTSVQ